LLLIKAELKVSLGQVLEVGSDRTDGLSGVVELFKLATILALLELVKSAQYLLETVCVFLLRLVGRIRG
jgi:hypothetical protein